MKYLKLVILFILALNLQALTIKLNSTKENTQAYYILHIIDSKPFRCEKVPISINKNKYICTINQKSDIKIKPKKSKYVDISILSKKKKTYIVLYPKAKVKISKIDKPLYKKKVIDDTELKTSTHWIFIFYKNNIFLKKSPKQGINFPVEFKNDLTPHVGALDPSGIPIGYLNSSKDINNYLSIKQDYKRKNYAIVVEEANKAIKNYPKSIFLNDFYLYKIRALKQLLDSKAYVPSIEELDYEEIIKIGRKWTKRFSSNPNIPEVLYYIAMAYQNLSQSSNANYFFDILITEHPKSRWTKLGIIAFADDLMQKNNKKKAVKLYKDVLYSAKDIEVASIAANRLAEFYLKNSQPKKAKIYFEKIINANPDYFLNDHEKAYEKALQLSSNNLISTSITLLEKLLKRLDMEPDLEENVIKKIGDLYSKLNDKKNATKYYKLYLKKFPYGQFASVIKENIDGLFFNSDEKNSTRLLMHYDNLIKKYKTGNIYKKAILLKSKLLIKLKNYKKALKELDKLKETNEIKIVKNRAALLLVQKYLLNRECISAIKLIKQYKLKLLKNIETLAKCYVDSYDYKNALKLADKQLNNNKLAIKKKLFWLALKAKIYLKNKRYKKLLQTSEDLITLAKNFKNKQYLKDGVYYKFFAYFGLKRYDEALKIAQNIENSYKNDFKNIEIYEKIIKYAKLIDNNLLIATEAKKIIDLQQKYKSYTLTPQIELTYITALKKLKKYKDAQSIAKALLQKDIKKDVKARVLYNLADISTKIEDKKSAKKYFKQCSELNSSSWSSLCKEGLSLYNNTPQ